MSTTTDAEGVQFSRLVKHFHEMPDSHLGKGWDDLWEDGYMPWDRGVPNPALLDFLAERQDLLHSNSQGKKNVLVPGCGSGYDVLLFSSWGYDAYGLEISDKALEAARIAERELNGKNEYEKKEGVREAGTVTWLKGDFFKDEFFENVEGEKNFDLIYDYTFCCALPPALRPAWSKRMNELLAPNGRLICMEFPTYKSPAALGPPWSLTPKVYMGHLPRPGQKLAYSEEEGLLEDELGPPAEDGLRRIEHLKPKRTHHVGYDEEGNVTDWIGVWVHQSSK